MLLIRILFFSIRYFIEKKIHVTIANGAVRRRMKKKDDEYGDGEGSRYAIVICHNPDSQFRMNV
jgi:hypothetical protein